MPALNYADYDGGGAVFDCDRFPAGACGTLLPEQTDLSAGEPPAAGLEFGAIARLIGSLEFGRVQIRSWRWRQLEGTEVALRDAEHPVATFRVPAPGAPLVFELTATDSEGGQYSDRISLEVAVDGDGDGLIEIRNLTMLHDMRHELTGAGYKISAGAEGNNLGCPAGGGCFGYELAQHLDFDTDGDGTWSGDSEEGYRLDPDDHHPDYFPVNENGAGGWWPITGNYQDDEFVAVFDGNGHRIRNLAIRRNSANIGFFGEIGAGAVIRNLGLINNLADYTGSSNHVRHIGGLVGLQEGGAITESYATGPADGGDGDQDYVGGLVGLQQGSITASYATGAADGGDGNQDYVGGLVGQQLASIIASYAKGSADGGDGDRDRVGGLVGWQFSGPIMASYATGAAAGGEGAEDQVGGLVGLQQGSITASYATGTADGGDGDRDRVGGLVGWQFRGLITASYATGTADGGDGDGDSVGGLVGTETKTITVSYGFGEAIGHESPVGPDEPSEGSGKPAAVSSAAQLSAANAGSAWNAAASHTLGAWDFGTDEQVPALNYADYDGAGAVFDCDQFPAGACGTLLPGQDSLSAGEPPASGLEFGATATLTGSVRFGRVQIRSWRWRQLEGTTVSLRDAEGPMATFRAPAPGGGPLVFELSATDSEGRQYSDRISLEVAVDGDGDGLIEIRNLSMLHNMRHDLEGASYKTSAGAEGNNLGCPGALCRGYELVQHLDFDTDGDGTWSGDGGGGYRLDPDDHHPDYFPVDENGAGGWRPIGDFDNPFAAVFEGNSHRISNVAIRRDQDYIGLFGAMGGLAAAIGNLGLIDNLADYTGSSEQQVFIGGLVGWQGGGSITASHATGPADGGGGNLDTVGGLVGGQGVAGSITESYATGAAAGGGGDVDIVGGLVGQQSGMITASYATGAADGGGGTDDQVGGLVGQQVGGMITASYATGAADGGGGNFDVVGGLVGQLQIGSITASYATGAADGGHGNGDLTGGLVGHVVFRASVAASYATGAAAGGDEDDDSAGRLVGRLDGAMITASYGFGGADGENQGSHGSPPVSTATGLSAINAGDIWNTDTVATTLGAWDFGDGSQIPALNYADYDGSGTVFDCDQFPAGACGTLLPGQDSLSAGEPPAAGLEFGATATLTGSVRFGRVQIRSWRWRQLEGTEVSLRDAEGPMATFRAPAPGAPLVFELSATDSEGRQYSDRVSLEVAVDGDGDGLIEIRNLSMLHNMRHDLTGASYKISADAGGNNLGCPAGGGCLGYELVQHLDFDGDGDGATWSGDSEGGYRLDPDDRHPDYFPVNEDDAGGWRPIGDPDQPFVAVFEGNSHTISHLAIRRNQPYVGLFGAIGEGAAIRNLGLVDNLADYTGTGDGAIFIGGLVGRQESGTISASYATGAADGGDGDFDVVGGLVGWQERGTISLSYATGAADGGGGALDSVGGLVGRQQRGTISLSYATGAADGGHGDEDLVGGLVGWQQRGIISASYATGAADGGGGALDSVGGLVGEKAGGLITASYARGAADGGGGNFDQVGGLVGQQYGGSIILSYARGDVNGGVGNADRVGGLVGSQSQGASSITESYATGAADGGGGENDFVGGLVGVQEIGTIDASYARGPADGRGGGFDWVGGLVGWQAGGSITSSYARGDVNGGGGGGDRVGGLVGRQDGGSGITASYATGDAAGGSGIKDSVGGLVGWQEGGSGITASYATGAADGGDGNEDEAGGLVGRQVDGSITASYATGAADGGSGGGDKVGRLAGWQRGGSVWQSYGFGGVMGGGSAGPDGTAKPTVTLAVSGGGEMVITITVATQLNEANAGPAWNAADSHTLGAWDFGSETQVPALNYADYDGGGDAFDCDRFPAGACGTDFVTLLPGQADVSAGRPSAVPMFGAAVMLTGALEFGRITISSWGWRQLQGTEVDDLTGADGRTVAFKVPASSAPLVFELTATGSDGYEYSDRIALTVIDPVEGGGPVSGAVDIDGDGLIDIRNLTMLYNMRYSLEGSSYRTDTASVGDASGCPAEGCRGYELSDDLDFDRNGDGRTWMTSTVSLGYSLRLGDHHPYYFPVAADGTGGWEPIGDAAQPFVAEFDGNGYRLRNLGVRRDQPYIGLFGVVGEGAAIRNLGLVDNLADYTGSSDEEIFIGGLVGWQETGTISLSYARGAADGGGGANDQVGGLVGRQSAGTIAESYAEGAAAGGGGDGNAVGGLVGWQETGTILLSYARGAADGGGGASDQVGGLVGLQNDGLIRASYATGAADGGGGASDQVGGLVGAQSGTIILSYATGAAAGGNGDGDAVGGLVGRQSAGSIRASYATGAAAGGDSVGGAESFQEGSSISAGSVAGPATGGDNIGGLVGWQEGGSIRASYATGEAVGGAGNDVVGALVGVQYGTIRSSYARGHARGGAGDDVVGALVGELVGGRGTGSIVASYAAGNASGGEGGNDAVGALVGALAGGGQITASVIASYGFGQVDGEELFGSEGTPLPEGVEEAADLTRDNAGQGWSDIDWDFGTGTQPPALKHSGMLLLGQGRAGAGGGVGGGGGGGGGGGSLNPLALALLALLLLPGWRRRLLPRRAAPLKPGAGATCPRERGQLRAAPPRR